MVPLVTASRREAAEQPRPSHVFDGRCNGTQTFQKVQLLSRQSTEYFPRGLWDHQDVVAILLG